MILYHAGMPGFGGGFLGVDVFFVISGYLITALILEQMRRDAFSLLAFYQRRARRILPMLFVVMALCVPPAWALMLPDQLENFGQSLVATVLFANNILLHLTSGYWAQASELKPLLHTWSLGVEEQYYLLIPLLMMAVGYVTGRSAGRSSGSSPGRGLAVFLGLVLLAGLGWAQWAAWHAPSANFYLIGSRSWELAAGGLLALWPQRPAAANTGRTAGLLAAAGLLTVLLSMALIDRYSPHPGLVTLPLVLGSLLVLRHAGPGNRVGRLLSGRGLVGIGLISYSAYLWHQPLFAFARLYSLQAPPLWLMGLLALLCLPLAWLSWRYVEQPCRDPQRVPARWFLPLMLLSALLLGAVGWGLHASSGFLQSWPELADDGNYGRNLNIAFNEAAFRFQRDAFPPQSERKRVLVIGNSAARDFINAGLESGHFSEHELVYRPDVPICIDKLTQLDPVDRRLIAASDTVVFASGFGSEAAACVAADIRLLETISEAEFIVIGLKRFTANLSAVMRLPEAQRYAWRAPIDALVLQANRDAATHLSGHYVDLLGLLMDAQGRVPLFTPGRRIISQDTRHLTRSGAAYVGGLLFAQPLLRGLK